jgi:hypothetical protein
LSVHCYLGRKPDGTCGVHELSIEDPHLPIEVFVLQKIKCLKSVFILAIILLKTNSDEINLFG